ncbi:MAG: dephospho-CoA kinase, partial [Chloroflexi bacterium]|nr:dephospho-CoA kinase [Chloroflexota bacterium]
LRVLEGITHPAVRTEVTNRIAELPRGVIVVLEAIKLLESGWSAHCEEIWVVMCSAEKQLQRLIHTRGMTEQEARMRIDAQPPQAEKLAAADVVIDSNETIEQMQARINTEWRRFTLQSGHA